MDEHIVVVVIAVVVVVDVVVAVVVAVVVVVVVVVVGVATFSEFNGATRDDRSFTSTFKYKLPGITGDYNYQDYDNFFFFTK